MEIINRLNKLSTKQITCIVALIIAAACLVSVVDKLTVDLLDMDLLGWFNESQRVRHGELPFIDFKPIYGPLSVIFVIPPGLITSDPRIYCSILTTEICLFIFLTTVIIIKICQLKKLPTVLVCAAYLFFMFATGVVTVRLDIFPLFFMLIGVYLFLKNKSPWSYTFLAIGGLIKLFPFMLIPVFIFASFWNKEDRKKMYWGVIPWIGILALIFLICGFKLFEYLDLGQVNRPFNEESLIGSFVLILAALGGPPAEVQLIWSYDVISPICDMLCGWWVYFLLCLMAGIYLYWFYICKNETSDTDENNFKKFIAICSIVFIFFIVMNKTYSKQFSEFFIPFLALSLCFRSKSDLIFTAVLYSLIMIFMPVHSYLLFFVRDLALLYIVYLMARFLVKGEWKFIPSKLEKYLDSKF